MKKYFWFSLLILGIFGLVACGEATPVAPAPTTGQTASTPPAGAALPTTTASSPKPVTAASAAPVVASPTAPAPVGSPTPGQATLKLASAIITKANGEKVALKLELARTSQEQETGLMGRLRVPDDQGMLFVFEQSGRVAFWMKDTPLSLSIAFIDKQGKIVGIQDMYAFSLDTHAPDKDYIYALEVAQGYFTRRGIQPGDLFTLGQ